MSTDVNYEATSTDLDCTKVFVIFNFTAKNEMIKFTD